MKNKSNFIKYPKLMFLSLTPELIVENMDASLDFYIQILDFQIINSVPDKAPFNWVMLRRDKVTIMLETKLEIQKESQYFNELDLKAIPRTILYLKVDNIEEFYKEIESKVNIVQPLHDTFYGSKEFAISDPDQNYILIAQ